MHFLKTIWIFFIWMYLIPCQLRELKINGDWESAGNWTKKVHRKSQGLFWWNSNGVLTNIFDNWYFCNLDKYFYTKKSIERVKDCFDGIPPLFGQIYLIIWRNTFMIWTNTFIIWTNTFIIWTNTYMWYMW